MRRLFASLLLCLTTIAPAWAEVTIYAAASTTNAVDEIAGQITESLGIVVKTSFASSSTLAKQVEAGAPAAIYLSANSKWMDYLEQRDQLVPDSRHDLLHNAVVLIAPEASTLTLTLAPGMNLASAFDGRLCMGDPGHVPAGMYGKAALESLGLWASVSSRIVATSDVRAALNFVAQGECELGIVYSTDARISTKVKVVDTFPAGSHPPVTYPIARIRSRGDTEEAAKVFDYLLSNQAAAVFQKYGFSTGSS